MKTISFSVLQLLLSLFCFSCEAQLPVVNICVFQKSAKGDSTLYYFVQQLTGDNAAFKAATSRMPVNDCAHARYWRKTFNKIAGGSSVFDSAVQSVYTSLLPDERAELAIGMNEYLFATSELAKNAYSKMRATGTLPIKASESYKAVLHKRRVLIITYNPRRKEELAGYLQKIENSYPTFTGQ